VADVEGVEGGKEGEDVWEDGEGVALEIEVPKARKKGKGGRKCSQSILAECNACKGQYY
jgi:hypothetical protein